MAGGNIGQSFAVSQSSGTVIINKPLDYELTQTYSLWLEARDRYKISKIHTEFMNK